MWEQDGQFTINNTHECPRHRRHTSYFHAYTHTHASELRPSYKLLSVTINAPDACDVEHICKSATGRSCYKPSVSILQHTDTTTRQVNDDALRDRIVKNVNVTTDSRDVKHDASYHAQCSTHLC